MTQLLDLLLTGCSCCKYNCIPCTNIQYVFTHRLASTHSHCLLTTVTGVI